MTSLTLLDKVVEAPQAAGATEEMIAAAEWFLGSLGIPHGVVATGRATTWRKVPSAEDQFICSACVGRATAGESVSLLHWPSLSLSSQDSPTSATISFAVEK